MPPCSIDRDMDMKDLGELWLPASAGTLEDDQRPPGGPGGTYLPREGLSGAEGTALANP